MDPDDTEHEDALLAAFDFLDDTPEDRADVALADLDTTETAA